MLDLARRSDVFLQNYRPGVAERLGMDYESIRAVRPDIVYVSISGYGESGPYANRPGQDMLLQAMSGAMLNVGRASDPPAPAGTYAVDAITGYGAFEGALAGLLHRERTGEGQLVTVNMLDSAIAVQAQELSIYTVGGIPQHRGREVHGHAYIRAPYGTFATADGYLALAFPPLAQLGEVLGIAEFAGMDDDVDGHARRDEITALVRARLPERSTAEWLAEFDARGIWAGPVYDYADVLADPQVQHNGSLVSYDHPTEGRVTTPGFPYRFSATPPEVYRGAPLAGEQTREILAELGYDGASVDRLAAGGVVAEAAAAGEPGRLPSQKPPGPGRSRDGPADRADLGPSARVPGAGRAGRGAGTGRVGALAAAVAGGVRVPAAAHPGRRLRPAGRGPSRARRGDPGRRPAAAGRGVRRAELAAWRTASVGASYDSYVLDGRPWALPLDAAAQVAVARPDLMEARPASWEQACQAARAYPTTLCLGGPHALLMFSAICVAAGAAPAREDAAAGDGEPTRDHGPFVTEAAGTAALAVMSDLLACADRELSQRNPIGVLDAMAASGGPAYCPLVYGYVTYQRPLGGEPGSSRLAAFDAPAGPGGIGSVLGGTGLAITRSAIELGAAAALIRTLLSDEVQIGRYAELGGQSSARQAWEHPGADAAGGGFYRATLATVEQAWVRPRFAGYPEFQTAASAVLREGLLAGEPHAGLVRRVNELYAAARPGTPRTRPARRSKSTVDG